MRWRTDDAQPALFADEVERHVGRGEFRGLTFFHVRARTIVNTVASGRLPFRHTVNAYRGCAHACSYCFARPTHDYLGLDVGEGFDREIVVKINAVERVRAEVDPRRWPGHAIAMGTNTDPYQRCEGKYRLTRGIVEVLGEARNPFSILTKSTLLLRDLDVLSAAAARTDVGLLLSVGTLDADVWRATEPGAPAPWKRLEAVARLREAGLRCGVLIAPVLPGLSDAPDQLRAVVAAARDAGASSISGGQLVYLTPPVRRVFLERLAGTNPDLVERYERLYRGTNAPKALRERTQAVLRDAIGPQPAVRVAAPARVRMPPAAEQLGLGV